MLNNVTLEAVEALIGGVEKRLDLFHDSLNDRLAMKDRWISDRFSEVDKRMHDALSRAEIDHEALKNHIDSLRAATLTEQDAMKHMFQMRFDMGQKRFDDYIYHAKERGEQIIASHMETHRVSEKNLEDFKGTVQQRLDVVAKTLETLREERGLFVLRDSHDAQIDALERLIDSLERAMMEKVDTAVKQLRESHDVRIVANMDRLTKLEQNLQVMNARNQQSIIALGILLTLVEIIIRYYQRG